MKVAIAGGKLQGVEASFLAQCLGWHVFVIDRSPNAPARGLCDCFHQFDLIRDDSALRQIIKEVDLVIPAVENVSALRSLDRCAASVSVPFAYDEKAHVITRSKKRSNAFFEKIGIPTPRPWPKCDLPVIVKPSTLSASQGVRKLSTEKEMAAFFKERKGMIGPWIIEEYLEGPSYSVEVLGFEDHFEILEVTELEMDDTFDCKRVLAPAKFSKSAEREFKEIALTIAKELRLKGIMDVEAIDHQGKLKILEIDARLPSQTPITVLKSTGINMLGMLGDIFVNGSLGRPSDIVSPKGVIYEQIRVSQRGIETLGEHVMGHAGPLRKIDNFYGADVALTNFAKRQLPWVAILIITGEDRKEAWTNRCKVIEEIEKDLERFVSSKPRKELDFLWKTRC